MPARVSADVTGVAAMGCGCGCLVSIASGAVILGFLVLDLAFDNPGSFAFAAFGEVVFCGFATVFWATGFWGEVSFLVLGNAFFDNAALGNAVFLATGFWGEVSFLVLGNAILGATGFLDEASLLVFDNAVFGVSGGVCFLGLVDFLLVGLEVLVIVFWNFSVLDLERLFFDIANLLILK